MGWLCGSPESGQGANCDVWISPDDTYVLIGIGEENEAL